MQLFFIKLKNELQLLQEFQPHKTIKNNSLGKLFLDGVCQYF